jgi:hypothetical protein
MILLTNVVFVSELVWSFGCSFGRSVVRSFPLTFLIFASVTRVACHISERCDVVTL